MRKTVYLIPVVVIVLALVLASIFIVDPRYKALVLQFGQVKQQIEKPGLYFKIPLIQTVVYYDGRILGLPTQPLEVTPADDRRIVVDAFARWRITDLIKFREATGNQGIQFAQQRLENILNAAIREVLGEVPSSAVLSEDRTPLMVKIRDQARKEAAALGVDVIDVRLTRTDLPTENLKATYARMQAEREREAADEIARGNEAAQRIRATADRTALELTSEAQKKADVIRGEADAKRNEIYAAAFGKDPEFFAFTRSLNAYAEALKGSNTTIVLSPKTEFFDYLNNDMGTKGAVAKGAAANGTAKLPMPGKTPDAAAVPGPTKQKAGSASGQDGSSGAAATPSATPSSTAPSSPAPAAGSDAGAAATGN
ncbi:protease modulator HflC [Acidimangrovimonas sediminis]|uniref:protease modulator HflC n=1 Tax=Acidimangrovimonas sediminis TaxID=2056283 RepID=UPI000C80B41D|nr:protease modulator HflC [Acidimangrovimonas sediminis]